MRKWGVRHMVVFWCCIGIIRMRWFSHIFELRVEPVCLWIALALYRRRVNLVVAFQIRHSMRARNFACFNTYRHPFFLVLVCDSVAFCCLVAVLYSEENVWRGMVCCLGLRFALATLHWLGVYCSSLAAWRVETQGVLGLPSLTVVWTLDLDCMVIVNVCLATVHLLPGNMYMSHCNIHFVRKPKRRKIMFLHIHVCQI